jgi:hypothetical protein
MSSSQDKSFIRRIFTLQFTRKLILCALFAEGFVLGVFLLLRFFPEKAFEFSSPYFGTIKATAATASNYLAEIEGIKHRVEGQRDTIDAAFANAATAQRVSSNASEQVIVAHQQLELMQTNTYLLQVIAQSYADDRKAFDCLVGLRFSQDQQISNTAVRAVNTIVNSLHRNYQLKRALSRPIWSEMGIDPETNTLPQLGNFYGKQFAEDRIFLLIYIADTDRFPKYDRFDYVVNAIKYETFVSVENAACEIMGEESKTNWNVLGNQKYLEWWENNKSKYVNTNSATVQH